MLCRLADEKAGVADKLAWETVKQDWVKRRQKIEARNKAAEKVAEI